MNIKDLQVIRIILGLMVTGLSIIAGVLFERRGRDCVEVFAVLLSISLMLVFIGAMI